MFIYPVDINDNKRRAWSGQSPCITPGHVRAANQIAFRTSRTRKTGLASKRKPPSLAANLCQFFTNRHNLGKDGKKNLNPCMPVSPGAAASDFTQEKDLTKITILSILHIDSNYNDNSQSKEC
jgi:hypothetical protein